KKFWPGPLTIVLRKTAEIVPEATAGLQTVGLRAPDHPLTLQLLRVFDGPIAGPSANESSRVSPTTAEHVRAELRDRVEMVLEGGACEVGIESTVLDLSGTVPKILRLGAVAREDIEKIIGAVAVEDLVTEATMPAKAPGQQRVHYAPRTVGYRFESSQRASVTSGAIIEIGR